MMTEITKTAYRAPATSLSHTHTHTHTLHPYPYGYYTPHVYEIQRRSEWNLNCVIRFGT